MWKQEWDAGADLSPCRTFRYRLWRRWAEDPALVLIGLNPSTADERADDPTIRRIVAFAKRWRFGAIVMLNLFAFRAMCRADMKASSDPIGPDNDATIRSALADARKCCAHGAPMVDS